MTTGTSVNLNATVIDVARMMDLMASACQAHAKGIKDAHAAEVSALKRGHAARERELLARIRALQLANREASKADPARAALVDLLASTRCAVSSIRNMIDLGPEDAPLRLPVSIATQNVVLSLAKEVTEARAAKAKDVTL